MPDSPVHVRSLDPAAWIRVPGRPLELLNTGQERDLTLVPLRALYDERYGVYWRHGPGAGVSG